MTYLRGCDLRSAWAAQGSQQVDSSRRGGELMQMGGEVGVVSVAVVSDERDR
jgi:hypothetical protein